MNQLHASFVPSAFIRRLVGDPTRLAEVVSERAPVTLLFADVSGFTRLAQELAAQGGSGADILTSRLNEYFEPLARLVAAHGGEIVSFHGDALLAVWPVTRKRTSPAAFSSAPLVAAHVLVTRQVAACALAIQNALNRLHWADRQGLTLRVVITAGQALLARVGGVAGRWSFVVAGEPMDQLGPTLKMAPVGAVTLSAMARDLAGDRVNTIPLDNGCHRLDGLVDYSIPLTPPRTDDDDTWLPVYRGHISVVIQTLLDRGQTAYLAQSSRLNVLFFHLRGLDYSPSGAASPSDAPRKLQEAVEIVQEGLLAAGAVMDKVGVDEKGTWVLAAFGLPFQRPVPDPSLLSVNLGEQVRQRLLTLGIRCTVGITSGPAFCGTVGSTDRREYTMIGATVNLAARFMVGMPPGVYCDQPTYEAARRRADFDRLETTGSIRLLTKHCYRFEHLRPVGSEVTVNQRTFGRSGEIDRIELALDDLEQGRGSAVFFHGEEGIGKTQLVGEVRERAHARGYRLLQGYGDPLDRQSPFHVWQQVFEKLLGLREEDSTYKRKEHLKTCLRDDAELEALLPYLLILLNLEGDSTSDVEDIHQGEARVSAIHRVAVILLSRVARQTRLVVVLENAQWLDSASWPLLLEVIRKVQPLLLVAAIQPLEGLAKTTWREIMQLPSCIEVRLGGLEPAALRSLVSDVAGARTCSERAATWCANLCEGRPLATRLLTVNSLHTGALAILDGVLELQREDVDGNALENDLVALVGKRVALLDISQQFVLKTASIVGLRFELSVLERVHPESDDLPQLGGLLDALVQEQILIRVGLSRDPSYIFKQHIVQKVIYSNLPMELKISQHRRVAEHLEERFTDPETRPLAVMAHHFVQAEDHTRALVYLERAGQHALQAGAYTDAIDFFQRCEPLLPLLPQTGESPAPRRARWHLARGDASYGLGELDQAQTWYESTMELLQEPVPPQRRNLLMIAAQQAFQQVIHLLLPFGMIEADKADRGRLADAARAAERISELGFFKSQDQYLAYSLMSANLVDRAGRPFAFGRPYASLAYLVGASLHVEWLGLRYVDRALEASATSDDLASRTMALYMRGAWLQGMARWAEARHMADEAEEVCRVRHLGQDEGLVITMIAIADYFQGRFHQALAQYGKLQEHSQQRSTQQHAIWSIYGQGEVLLPMGRPEEAAMHLREGLALLDRFPEQPSELLSSCLLAVALLRSGKHEELLPVLERAWNCARKALAPSGWMMLEAYAGLAECSISLWERDRENREAQQVVKLACRNLWIYALIYPIGRARGALMKGHRLRVAGRIRAARRCWRRSLVLARRLERPSVEALAEHALATWGGLRDDEARAHADRARALFAMLAVPPAGPFMTDREEVLP